MSPTTADVIKIAAVLLVCCLIGFFLAARARWKRGVARLDEIEERCFSCARCDGPECGEFTVAAPCTEVPCPTEATE